MRIAAILIGALGVGCRQPAPASSPAPGGPSATPANPAARSPAPGDTMVRIGVTVGDRFYPVRGDSALQAFVPDVAPVDSGGECRLFRTGGSGATIVSAYFPSFDSARTLVTLAFDSAGHLARFSETRGMVRIQSTPGMSPAQRDSARRAIDAAVRSTSISFDYAIDQAVAANRGGGLPNQAVIGSVRSMEGLEKLGPPIRRLERVRRLCSV